MSDVIKITTPLTNDIIESLRAGDRVEISGLVLTGRDQAHKRICKAIDDDDELPVELSGQLIYFVGPTPPREGKAIGAAGPTTSSRMDAFSPKLLASAGLKAMIGKGYRGEDVRSALVEFKAVHFAAIGGAGALLSEHIKSAKVVAYEDLGTEAIRELQFENFPAVVAYDCHGNSVYEGE